MREFSAVDQSQMRTRGRGSKILKILRTSYMDKKDKKPNFADPPLVEKLRGNRIQFAVAGATDAPEIWEFYMR